MLDNNSHGTIQCYIPQVSSETLHEVTGHSLVGDDYVQVSAVPSLSYANTNSEMLQQQLQTTCAIKL